MTRRITAIKIKYQIPATTPHIRSAIASKKSIIPKTKAGTLSNIPSPPYNYLNNPIKASIQPNLHEQYPSAIKPTIKAIHPITFIISFITPFHLFAILCCQKFFTNVQLFIYRFDFLFGICQKYIEHVENLLTTKFEFLQYKLVRPNVFLVRPKIYRILHHESLTVFVLDRIPFSFPFRTRIL